MLQRKKRLEKGFYKNAALHRFFDQNLLRCMITYAQKVKTIDLMIYYFLSL